MMDSVSPVGTTEVQPSRAWTKLLNRATMKTATLVSMWIQPISGRPSRRVPKNQSIKPNTAAIPANSVPNASSQAEKVTFDFDATAPVVRQVEQVLAAIDAGAVAPDVGKQIIEAIGSLSAIRATEELEARLTALEAKEKS